MENDVIILTYHHVAEPPPRVRIRGLYVTPAQFRRQIAWLKKKGARFRTFQQLASRSRKKPGGSHRFDAVLTFDDGHLDNYSQAFPILRQFEIPAVVYPVVGDLGKQNIFWDQSVDKHPVNILEPEHIIEMANEGIEFGSHLMHHIHLTRQEPDKQSWELKTSKAVLENILQKPVFSVAYPYGDWDENVADRAQKAGYRFGVTTSPGIAERTGNPWTLKRNAVKGSKFYHPLKFRRKMVRLLSAMNSV